MNKRCSEHYLFSSDPFKVAQAIRAGFPINDKYFPNYWYPVINAAAKGYYDSLKLLIKHNANLNVSISVSNTPLYYALYNDHSGCVDLLLSSGVERYVSNKQGIDPTKLILLASSWGKVGSLKVLMKHGDDINAVDDYARNALHYAANSFFLDVAKELIANNIDVNSKDVSGKTPLHLACCTNHPEMVELLIDSGAKVDAQTYDIAGFKTPLLTMLSSPIRVNSDIVRILLKNGADPKATSKEGNSALWYARLWNRRGIVKLLKQAGANE